MGDPRNPESEAEPVVIAIDPGRAKCGVAVVSRSGGVLHREIATSDTAAPVIRDLVTRFRPVALILGDGTGSRATESLLRDVARETLIEVVDEKHTSEAARALYLQDNPPRGLSRLIPRPLRSPESAYDDYVSVILATRWWESRTS